jgi:hypothetical protein
MDRPKLLDFFQKAIEADPARIATHAMERGALAPVAEELVESTTPPLVEAREHLIEDQRFVASPDRPNETLEAVVPRALHLRAGEPIADGCSSRPWRRERLKGAGAAAA